MMHEALAEARAMLESVTPLKRDCGRVCGAACCSSMEGEETGMMLFPGEEAIYQGRPGWRITVTSRGTLLFCPGVCRREERPLACRIFPLLPVPEGDGVRVVTDLRAKAVCPLARQGKSAMDPAFVVAVRKAGERLLEVPEQKAALMALGQEQEELKQLRKEWRT